MFRSIYLSAMGAGVGAVTAAACGHTPIWLTIGLALGLAWSVKEHRAQGPRLKLHALPATA